MRRRVQAAVLQIPTRRAMRLNPSVEAMVTLLVDDTKLFKDGRDAAVARTSDDAIAALARIGTHPIDELWLDYDLLFGITSQPFDDRLLVLAASASPSAIGTVSGHTSQIRDGHAWSRPSARRATQRDAVARPICGRAT